MSDFEDSDEERYANESFENETDNEVAEISEIENENIGDNDNNRVEEEGQDDDDDDADDLPSVKLNTGPIKRNNFCNNFTNHHKTDAVPFASSSDEEDDVILGQTLAEINTPSMHFADEPQTPTIKQFESKAKSGHHYANSVQEEQLDSSDEISEYENEEDEDEEFKRIQEMEERYMLQNSAKTPKVVQTDKTDINQKVNGYENSKNVSEEEHESDIEDEEINEEEEVREPNNTDGDEIREYTMENIIVNEGKKNISNDSVENLETDDAFRKEKIDLVEVIENTITNLKLLTKRRSEEDISKTNQMLHIPLIDENVSNMFDSTKIVDSETTFTATNKNEHQIVTQLVESSSNQNFNSDKGDYSSNEQEQESEVERIENNADNFEDYKRSKYDEDEADVYYNDCFDYRITSKTPSSFNSDDYIFHANFIKQIHRTNSTDKLRPKPHPRKSMSFSNDRMREIERHNQILLRKILTQKPTYNLKGKSSQGSLQKPSLQSSNTRLTTSAVNRKKQQRQIDLNNQILKRKIEAIAMRRRPLIS